VRVLTPVRSCGLGKTRGAAGANRPDDSIPRAPTAARRLPEPDRGESVMAGQTFVIVGASLAGAKAAETLREEGFDGRVVLVGAERERPYERPPLSKDYLRREADGKPYVHEAAFYGENEIELRTSTTVAGIDPVAGEVMLANGEGLGFDRLLLAAGAKPRRLRVPGVELDGVLYLRTV